MLRLISRGSRSKVAMPERVQRFAEITTFHGIRDFVYAGNKPIVIRPIWLIILLFAAAFLVYEIVQVITVYAEERSVTNIQLEKRTRHEIAAIITPYVCLSDWISRNKTRGKYNTSQLLALEAFSNNNTGYFINYPEEDKNLERRKLYVEARHWVKHYQDMLQSKSAVLEDFYDDIIKEFPFRPIKTSTDKRGYFIFVDSVCVAIALEPATDVVGVPIYRTEVDLLLNDTDEIVGDIAHMHKYEIALMFYHGTNMRYLSEIDRIVLNFNISEEATQFNLRMRFRQIQRLNKRSKECVIHQPQESESKYPVNYRRQICMQRCMDNRLYIRAFNCTFFQPRLRQQIGLRYLNPNYEKPLCTADKFFANKHTREFHIQTLHACQDTCDKNATFCKEFDISLDRMRTVPARTCNHRGCFNLAIVAQPTVEIIEEVLLMTFETLLSDLGGQAGLWFGGSILSVVQLVFFCMLHDRCVDVKHYQSQRRKKVSKGSRPVAESTASASEVPDINTNYICS